MLQSVSWQQYFTALLGACVVYYFFVWALYFRGTVAVLRPVPPFAEDQPDEILSTTQHIIEELRPLFAGKKNKNELILALQQVLRKYNQWEEPGFRETVNLYIENESQAKCSIRLSEEDLRVLWQ